MQSEISGDAERIDLIQLLILEAGRIIEDAGPDFAMRLPNDLLDRRLALIHLRSKVEAIGVLVAAAQAICSLQASEDA